MGFKMMRAELGVQKNMALLSSTMMLLLCLMSMSTTSSLVAQAFKIEPGIGLTNVRTGEKGIVFEHTEYGTGALIWNRATPVRLKDLGIPRFRDTFAANPLMMGCGIDSSSTSDDDKEANKNDSIRIGDMAPWFWLHDCADLEGSFRLKAAKGPLFMGGNIETVTEMIKERKLDPNQYRFKFFWKYKGWEGSKLAEEIEAGVWQQIEPQDPDEVLQT